MYESSTVAAVVVSNYRLFRRGLGSLPSLSDSLSAALSPAQSVSPRAVVSHNTRPLPDHRLTSLSHRVSTCLAFDFRETDHIWVTSAWRFTLLDINSVLFGSRNFQKNEDHPLCRGPQRSQVAII